MLPLSKVKHLILLMAIISVDKNYVFVRKAVEYFQCQIAVFLPVKVFFTLFFVLKYFFFPRRYVRNTANASDIPTAVVDYQLRVLTVQ